VSGNELNELGVFLRNRREALSPARAGLPAGPRRRAPGLRRSEVAMLAGVSVEYITRLEQGRDRRPSPQVVAALAHALQLTAHERAHFYKLSKAADTGQACMAAAMVRHSARPPVQALLDRMDATPAALFNRLSDVVACTAAYRRLMEPLGLFESAPANLARFVFTDPRARAAYPDWEHVADEQAATLKHGPFRANPQMAMLVDELAGTAGEAFARRVRTLPGLPQPNGVLRLIHPGAGELRLAFETLDLPADDDQRLMVYLPADAAASAALDDLERRGAPALRLVAGSRTG
jgi:transcriptional regulator with XRE-family HTH domain